MRIPTPQKIIDAALAVFAHNPLATLDQVAEAADMSRATLFRHFSGKKALMRELSLEAERRCLNQLTPHTRGEGPPMARFARAVEALIPLGAAFHFLTYEPWHTDDTVLEQSHQAYLDEWAVLISQLRAAGFVDSSLPPFWVVTTLDVLLYGAWEAVNAGEIAPRQAAALTLRTFLHGVGASRAVS